MLKLNNKLKLVITGDAKHGKDTVCEFLRDMYGFSFVSSSYFIAERAVRPYLAEKGIVYDTLDAYYADRINHRIEWHKAIRKFNEGDEARLAKELFKTMDIYCGLRSIEELTEMRRINLIDAAIWVDRSKHVKAEIGSNTIKKKDCDYVLDNNNSLQVTKQLLVILMGTIDENTIPF